MAITFRTQNSPGRPLSPGGIQPALNTSASNGNQSSVRPLPGITDNGSRGGGFGSYQPQPHNGTFRPMPTIYDDRAQSGGYDSRQAGFQDEQTRAYEQAKLMEALARQAGAVPSQQGGWDFTTMPVGDRPIFGTPSGEGVKNFLGSPQAAGGTLAAQPIPAALSSLPVEVIAANEARRRRALSDYQEALARGGNEMGRIEAQRAIDSSQLAAQLENTRFQGFSNLASIGQARSPRFADRLRRDLTRAELQARGQIERSIAMQMQAVQDMIDEARRARSRQLLQLESDEAMQRSQIDRLFAPPSFGG